MKVEKTPNRHSLKFVTPHILSKKAMEFQNSKQADPSPLAKTILGFPWAKQVFIFHNFITITKEKWVEWDTLTEPLMTLIQEYMDNQNVIVSFEKDTPSNAPSKTMSQTAKHIQKIIEKEIQPMVAMDGGFIEFSHYEKGHVYLRMKGACSGCPSAEWTLKEGIAKRLKQEISEIKKIISI